MKKSKRFLAAIITVMMVMTLLPAMALAADIGMEADAPELTVNTSTIGFAGQEWYVIGYNGAGVDSTAGDEHATLLVKGGNPYGSTTMFGSTSDYSGSPLQAAMGSIYASFGAGEQALITARTLPTGEANHPIASEVENQTLWPLSYDEWHTITDNTVLRYGDDWWLRSPNGPYTAFVSIGSNSTCATGSVNVGNGATRPAFKLNLSTVLFTSDAAGGKSSATVGGGLVGVAAPTGAVKLTVRNDGNLSLSVTDTTDRTAKPGGTVDIAYTGAVTGTNNYVSCVLTDTSGSVLYYGKLASCAAETSGTASFTVPAGLAEGSYTIKIFNEECNGDYFTDFASTPVELALTVAYKPYHAAQIAFGGRVWDVIGYDGAGVASDEDVATLLLANITGNGFADTVFRSDLPNTSIYSGSPLQAAMNSAASSITNAKESGLIVRRDLPGGAEHNEGDGMRGVDVTGARFCRCRYPKQMA